MGRRIIFPEKGVVRLEPFEPRQPGQGEVLLASLYSLMSIGTETTILHAKYALDTHFAQRFSFPQIKTGVQTVARVEGAGADVDLQIGDVVFVRMGHASHCIVPAEQCTPVPRGLDLKQSCWCGLAKTAFRAAHAAPFTLGARLLIIGAGPVGQMAIRWAKAAGAQDIAVIDVSPLRLDIAVRGGATMIFEGKLAELHEELGWASRGGFEIVVDTTGAPEVFAQAQRAAGEFGRIVLLGDTGFPRLQCLSSEVMTKGLSIVATHDHQDRGGWTQPRIDALFFHLVGAGSFDLDGLITHEFAPSECEAAYRLANEQRDIVIGLLFNWH
jgi:2-desacetyl-2-hydroxyethyl bacteriochlorophyllide A dehydrogenase